MASYSRHDLFVEFLSLQYALYMSCFVCVLGGAFFLATALFIQRDREQTEKMIKGCLLLILAYVAGPWCQGSGKKKKKKIPHRPRSVARELILCRPVSRRGWNPIKLAYKLARWPAQLAASAFNQLSQYVNSRGHVTQNSRLSFLASS